MCHQKNLEKVTLDVNFPFLYFFTTQYTAISSSAISLSLLHKAEQSYCLKWPDVNKIITEVQKTAWAMGRLLEVHDIFRHSPIL